MHVPAARSSAKSPLGLPHTHTHTRTRRHTHTRARAHTPRPSPRPSPRRPCPRLSRSRPARLVPRLRCPYSIPSSGSGTASDVSSGALIAMTVSAARLGIARMSSCVT
eukprot:2870556-Pleurochrysis_carterae.AAC.1